MPSKMVEFNKHLQILSFDEQISKINFVIDKMLISNTIVETKENIDRKFTAIKELKALRKKIIKDNKEIITFLYILFVLNNSLSLNSGQ